MEDDHRQNERTSVSIGVVLDFSSGTREARISDLSRSGCFIDSIAKVADGEHLSFRLDLSTGQKVKLLGEVVYVYPGIGFGLRFINLTEEDRALLEQIILANGGKPLKTPDPGIEKETMVDKKPSGQEESLDNMETTPFAQLRKSIRETIERSTKNE